MVKGSPAHHVVIIGSGFGGLFAARALRRAPVRVTMIDRVNHHLFQPLLYQVATGILSEGGIAPATRDVLRHHRHTEVLLGEVTDIDLEHRVVHAHEMEHRLTLHYDSLIVAAGVQTSYFGHDEYAEWAPGMKSIDDALEIRGRILGAFEMAEAISDEEARRAWLTFVVVGGGPTGVEMAGQIAELAHRSLRGNFRSIDPASARILLFEGTDHLLGSFGPRLSKMTRRDLERLGVEVRTGTLVTGMDEAGVRARSSDGTVEWIAARTKVWAAGMEGGTLGRRLAQAAGAETDRAGRIKVGDDCTLPGHPEVFVVGDMMALDDLPGVAEVAMQSGHHAAKLIVRRLSGDHRDPPFRYRDLGSLAAVSRFRAVAKLGRLSVGGFLGWLLWLVVHLTFLTGFKNRVGALGHWAVSFIGWGRSERTITAQQIIARHAIARLQDGPSPDGPAQPLSRTLPGS